MGTKFLLEKLSYLFVFVKNEWKRMNSPNNLRKQKKQINYFKHFFFFILDEESHKFIIILGMKMFCWIRVFLEIEEIF
jgi:hypothetical protein